MNPYLSSSDWFITLATVFGGIIAAVAIYIAFRQLERLHYETITQSIKDQRCERKLSELRTLTDSITDVLSNSLHSNTMTRLSDKPHSVREMQERYDAVNSFYFTIEKGYNQLFLSRVLCDDCQQCDLSDAEKKLTQSRITFTDAYRELYNALHDFVNLHRLNLYDLHCKNGKYIWEITEIINGTQTTGILPAIHGELVPPLLETDNDDWIEVLNRRNQDIKRLSQQEDKCLSNINECVKSTRNAFIEFVQTFQNYEENLRRSKV